MLLALLISAAPITLVKDPKAITDAIAEHKGRRVVLKVWATWCGTCIEEFPDFLATMKAFPDVAVVSVSADDPQTITRYVQPFLDRLAVPYPTLLLDDVKPKTLTAAIDPRWDGTLPALFVYEADGTLKKRFIGPARGLRKLLSQR